MLKKMLYAAILFSLPICLAAAVNVQTGSTQLIIYPQLWDTCPRGNIAEFENGDLQVVARSQIKRSSDNGLSWTDGNTSFSSYTYSYAPSGAMCFYGVVNETDQSGLYLTTMLVSDDNGVSGYVRPAEVVLERQWEGVIASSHSQIIELEDGTLLASMYGTLSGDSTTRAFALKSEDRGQSWVYLSTIAHDELNMPGGFNESDLLIMPGGTIHCFVRSENSPSPDLYLCTSYDNGESWSQYSQIFDRAASPHALLMDNGIIVVATGRPGNWLLFSDDGGETWGDSIEYYTGPNPPGCSNYTSLAQSGDGEILVVYTRTDALDNTISEVAGTFFSVTYQPDFSYADINDDQVVDQLDLMQLAQNWLYNN
jgi:hypothetical protein